MIHQLSPPLHLQTPKGAGWAHFVLDYGPEAHVVFGVFLDDGGACWWVPNPEVRLSPNWTMERRYDAAKLIRESNEIKRRAQDEFQRARRDFGCASWVPWA